jgi:NADPH:quinone reductase-like Zn-dependent oxidoreductase
MSTPNPESAPSPAPADSYRAIVLEKSSAAEPATLNLRQLPRRAPGAGEVVVALKAAALNRRDVWIRLGKYGGIRLPCVLGSDGAGVVEAVGAGVPAELRGQQVVINPSIGWGAGERAQGPDYRILGMPEHGTFAEQIVVPAANLAPKPAHLSWAEAAALPLAGLTAYRALLVRGALRPGETVLIPGIGSGVSTMVLMLAKHLGARAIVTSSSAEKLAAARELGADFGVNYRDADWPDQILRHCGRALPDLAVDGAGGESWAQCLNLVRPGGRIVSYGATAGLANMDIRKLFWKQLNVLGSTMGSERDFNEMVAMVGGGKLRPRVDQIVPLAEAERAHARMENGEHMGKIVLHIAD